MLDPNRIALNAATVGFRKRMGQSVNWASFNESIQVQTEAIKVRRELEETPISEIHVMGGQRFGIGGNAKTNELARQARQMNGYPLRSFYATGGAIVVPQKHGEGLMATPQNVGLTSYAQYNGVVGNYVSSFTEPLNAPMDSNMMLLARTGAQMRSTSISNPYKVLQFQLNMNATLDQIKANEKKHKELRAYNQEGLARDIGQYESLGLSTEEKVKKLKKKRPLAAENIDATSAPGSGVSVVDPNQPTEGTALNYQNVVAQLGQLFQARAVEESAGDGLNDLGTNSYASPNTPYETRDPTSLLKSIERSLVTQEGTGTEVINRTKRRNTTGSFKTPKRITEMEEKEALENTPTVIDLEAFMKSSPTSLEELNKQTSLGMLAQKFNLSYEEADTALAQSNGNVMRAARILAERENAREQALNEAHITNVMEQSLLNQELPPILAHAAEQADDEDFGPTGTFRNPYEDISVNVGIVSNLASQTKNGLNISNGAPQSNPSAGFAEKILAQTADGSDLYEFGTPTVRQGPTVYGSGMLEASTQKPRSTSRTRGRINEAIASGNKKTPNNVVDYNTFMSDYKEGPASRSRSTGPKGNTVYSFDDTSIRSPVKAKSLMEELTTPKGNKVRTYTSK